MLGVFADRDVNGVQGSGEQFGKQLAAATGCAVYSFVVVGRCRLNPIESA
jgi:ammonia channel protein AmtB